MHSESTCLFSSVLRLNHYEHPLSDETKHSICIFAITKAPIQLSTILHNDTVPVTIENIRRMGILYLERTSRKDYFTMYMSFYNMKKLLLNLPNIVIPDNLLFFPSLTKPWHWHEFELLYPHFQDSMIKAFSAIGELHFTNILRGSYGVGLLPNVCG
ncbi:hypothetical protein SAMD00019534_083840 [Acytostelium subglobosum LB1]|uniref:hypothetical protein n=1 Tax=Acytostelium subglobosum LB1 TaxID=1410327 RepID=UPI000644943E|nr:hypothetical protein SAMD00019534_083840 [Acytostelium subglobosum LB1]GAM25209.1 hypothetical protein SAMD00019534_083840 [Acytostelium subglobosum LB1]|eukprot:XP_012751729.1 hypothetical protein SAMD00019534_083840 [Acytostelium subglobosum LB1]